MTIINSNFEKFAVSWVISDLKACETENPLKRRRRKRPPSNPSESSSFVPTLDDTDSSDTELPQYSLNEMDIREQLGSGGFSSVYCVAIRSPNTEVNLALKCLRPSKIQRQRDFLMASQDLYLEATLLAQLDHANIIRLCGIPTTGLLHSFFRQTNGKGPGFFLLLELLEETLHYRLGRWRKEQQYSFLKMSLESLGSGSADRKSGSTERLTIAMEIAKGMNYLHKQGIVLRDLKPENVGFDSHGTVKIFDLGLARPFKESLDTGAIAGSYRFMAPENLLCQPSGYPSDVYSFGVLLWELMTLQRPYAPYFSIDKGSNQATFDMDKFVAQVIDNEWRPPLAGVDSEQCKTLIQKCWASKPSKRPEFGQIMNDLHQVIVSQQQPGKRSSKQQRPTLRRSRSSVARSRHSQKEYPRRSISRNLSDVGCKPTKQTKQVVCEQKPEQEDQRKVVRPGDIFAKSLEGLDPICSGDERSSRSFQAVVEEATCQPLGSNAVSNSTPKKNLPKTKRLPEGFFAKRLSTRKLFRSLSSSSRTNRTDISESGVHSSPASQRCVDSPQNTSTTQSLNLDPPTNRRQSLMRKLSKKLSLHRSRSMSDYTRRAPPF